MGRLCLSIGQTDNPRTYRVPLSFQVKQPETEDEFKQYYRLRWQLLRAPWKQPEGTETDSIEDRCFHVMAMDDVENVIAVARLQINSATEAQVRYMAVTESQQGRGIGRALMETMEDQAHRADCKQVILDAREASIGFYQALGYKTKEKNHLLFNEIQHYRMIKEL